MPDGFYKVVAKIITDLGYYKIKGGKGSHEKWYNDDHGITLTIPHNMRSRHTANGILKDAGYAGKI